MRDLSRDERRELLLILLLAAALRLSGLDLWPGFSGDEGYETYYGWQIAHYGIFQQNPVRPYLGPWFLWLMAPFLGVLGAGPGAARLPVALLGTGSVALAWAVGRRLGGRSAGRAAGLLLAVAPFAVLVSRLSLSVATMSFWSLLTPWLALRLFDRPTAGRGAATGAALGAAVAFHPQALVLGPVLLVLALALPDGRAAIRRPRVLGAAALGFAAWAWPVWAMILDQVGLGPGIDYSGTWQDPGLGSPLLLRLAHAPGQYLDGFVGGRIFEWISGPATQNPPGELVTGLLVVVALGLAGWRLRRAAPLPRAWALGAGTAVLLTVLRSSDFDLDDVARGRYLLAGLTLTTPLLGWGLQAAGDERAQARVGATLLTALVVLMGASLITGFFVPMTTTGGDGQPSWRTATPDAKVQAADWIRDRLADGEEGLLLAGDAWTYWPIVALSGDRFPSDFVPESTADCAAILRRTDHRRRWLVDYVGWYWNQPIALCLAAVGRGGLRPALSVDGNDGQPLLWVWELPPGALGGDTSPPRHPQ